MRSRASIAVVLAITTTLPWPVPSAAQIQTSADVNQSHLPPRYSEVIARAFKFSEGMPSEFVGLDARVVIRYLPSSSQTESQTVLLKKKDGTVLVVRYRLKAGSPPISQTYEQAVSRDPSITLDKILENIRVEKKEYKVQDSAVEALQGLFSISIPTNLNSDICMDGTIYEMWIQTPSNEIHVSLSDCAFGRDTPSVPLIRWLKGINSRI